MTSNGSGLIAVLCISTGGEGKVVSGAITKVGTDDQAMLGKREASPRGAALGYINCFRGNLVSVSGRSFEILFDRR